MSIRSNAARTVFAYTGDQTTNEIQQARNELAAKVNGNPLANAVTILGLLQTDGSTSDGVAFTIGGSQELAHGLGRRAAGFAVIDSQTGPAWLYRVAVTTGLEDTHIKLTHHASAPLACSVKLAVW